MKKYPKYKKEILEYCAESEVDDRERYWIDFFNSSHRDYGYNRDSGGNANKHLSEDLKKQLSANHKGLFAKPVLQYDLHGNFVKEWTSEKEVFDALGLTINACCKGRQKTSGGYQWKLKEDNRIIEDIYNPIEQYLLNGNFVKEWDSIVEASESTGISSTCIASCCTGKRKVAGGYQWKRKNDERISMPYKRKKSSTSFKKGQPAYNKGVGRKVLQYDRDGSFVKEWNCVADAQRELKVFNISKSCTVDNSLVGGYQWKYADGNKIIKPYIKKKRIMSEESKKRLSIAKKGKPTGRKGMPGMKGVSNPRSTPILQYDSNGEFIREWEYISLAAKHCGIAPSTITGALKGYQKTAGGYIWKYK